LPDEAGVSRVFFDHASLPATTRDARERERQRELVRLLYVTLTRARRALILPQGEAPAEGSFLELWGVDLAGLPWVEEGLLPSLPASTGPSVPPAEPTGLPQTASASPRRILPHQLARKPDLVRAARHESAAEEASENTREDPIEYGVWWHEAVEFMPWAGSIAERAGYLLTVQQTAEKRGFGERAGRELARLQASSLWAELTSAGWEIFAELSVVAPLGATEWVDGVIDLVAQKPGTGELLVVDWKTNQRRPGEEDEALLARLMEEYRPQLQAYASCLARFFPKRTIRWGVYATAAGSLALG